MANQIRNVGFFDYDAEQQEILRRRKLAEAMMQAGQTPLGPTETIGGWAVKRSPLEGIGKMAQAASGAYLGSQATERSKALAERMRAERSQDYEKLMGATQPQPEIAAPSPEAGGGPGRPAMAPTGINPALIAKLRSPEVRQLATQQMMKSAEPYTLGEGQKRFVGPNVIAQGGPRTFAPQKPEPDKGEWSAPYQMGGAWVQKNSVTGQVRQAVAREPRGNTIINAPAVTPVTVQDPNDPNSTVVLDGRTGKVLGKGPKLTDTGKLETKRQFAMQGIGASIQEAEALLTNKAKPPTGSGIGAVYDVAAGVFGASPAGAVEAQKLKAIGGALVAKMPRMEGPQSDRDVALYKEMAGMVGDPTVPIDRRVGALEEVKKIWQKYERLNPEAFDDRRNDIGAPPPGAVRPR